MHGESIVSPYDVLWDIANAFSYLFKDEVNFLLKTVSENVPKDGIMVNVGAGSGTSGLAMAIAQPNANLFTVDFTLKTDPRGGIGNEKEALERAGLLVGMVSSGMYTVLHGDSRAVADAWSYGPVDFVFIDDGHQYDEAYGDIEKWLKNLKPGGVIMVHDFEKRENYARTHPGVEITAELEKRKIKPWPGVDRAVHDLLMGKHEYVGIADTLVAFRKKG